MTQRWLCVFAGLGLLSSLTCCKVYDPSMLDPSPTSGRSGGGGGVAGHDAVDAAVEACVPSAETCNEIDDDCDGIVDNAAPANEDCSMRYHASITCSRGGLCLFIPSRVTCYPGWYHCDGLPENGCESPKPCCATCDAGMDDDGGSDDAGSLR